MNRLSNILVLAAIVTLLVSQVGKAQSSTNHYRADVIVYGGTSGAVTAAVQAAKMDKSVIMVSPDKHLGGLSSGGLGFTDVGNKAVIGGLSREFYHRVYQHYQDPAAWRWQDHSEFGELRGQGTAAVDKDKKTMWIFEPHVAEQVFDNLVAEHEVTVLRDEWLDRKDGVTMQNGRIVSFETLSGKVFHGAMFIDVTYEGDLMAAAGVDYLVGREANSVYDENWNGVQTGVYHHSHYFPPEGPHVDPYYAPGQPSSGIIPRVSTDPPGEKGSGDKKIQAYCFRMCLSSHPDNKVPFPMPESYDASQYLGLLRLFESGWHERNNFFTKFDEIPNRKTDTNNHGPFSTDNIGMNYAYPEASYAKREEIIKEHEVYQKGLMYFLANDPRVPEEIQTEINKWGLAADEFTDNGHWPHQLYIREARRMIGRYVMTEHEIMDRRAVPEPVGMGSYTMDSHNVQRYITPEGYVQNEGDIGVKPPKPYQIAYGSIIPKRGQAGNLLVPVAMSASHIAFGSIRMEPVFMILGQSAGTAAALSIEQGVDVQALEYAILRKKLLEDGQVLEYEE
ncbi:MAG: FAD-dependent oxidoreductase [Balneolaceae bacterium]|nr:FAD-dependent oxidoreductase [Balneolaceae bacterium]